MITRIALPLFAASLLLFGCGQAVPPEATANVAADVARVVKEVTIHEGVPVTLADLSIEGMSCEMMCGGSIKKALARIPGVASTQIAFVEGDEQDHAIVTYDETQVTDAQMIEAIQQLHDGQYKVMAVTITKQVKGQAPNGVEGGAGKEANGVKAFMPSKAILPSLFGLLTSILRH